MATATTAAVTPHGTSAYIVPSSSTPDDVHVVKVVRGGLSCDCTAALYGKPCRHVALVAAFRNDEMRWERARKQAALEDARRIVTNRLMGRPDDYLIAAD